MEHVLGTLCAAGNIHNMGRYNGKMCLGITQFFLEKMKRVKGKL
jgi:hypothetical protein